MNGKQKSLVMISRCGKLDVTTPISQALTWTVKDIRFLLLCFITGGGLSSRGMFDNYCEFSHSGSVSVGIWQFSDWSIKVKYETKYLLQPYCASTFSNKLINNTQHRTAFANKPRAHT